MTPKSCIQPNPSVLRFFSCLFVFFVCGFVFFFCLVLFFFPLQKKKTTCKNLFCYSVSVFGLSTLLTDSNCHSNVFPVIIPCLSKQTDVLCTAQSYIPESVKLPMSFWREKFTLFSRHPETLLTELNKRSVYSQ